MIWSDKLVHFYDALIPPSLPPGFNLLYPQQDPAVRPIVSSFLKKFYSDNRPRRLVFGINPGRFGAGTTGVNFTAPKQLKEFCGIDHPFKSNQSELSAEFIYQMISAFGGVEKFYSKYFISSVSPLGFTKDGINMNYYDNKELLLAVTPFITDSIQRQVAMGFLTDRCYCIGGDKNLKFLSSLNDRHSYFDEIIPLPHPRFIMQYRRKFISKYIKEYLSVLQ